MKRKLPSALDILVFPLGTAYVLATWLRALVDWASKPGPLRVPPDWKRHADKDEASP